METSIYKRMLEKGVPVNNHESDLYVPVNDTTKDLIDGYEFKQNVTTFVSTDEELCFELPFAYDPFWEQKQR